MLYFHGVAKVKVASTSTFDGAEFHKKSARGSTRTRQAHNEAVCVHCYSVFMSMDV